MISSDFNEMVGVYVAKTFNDAVVIDFSSTTNYIHDNDIQDAGFSFNAEQVDAFCLATTTVGSDKAWCDFYSGSPPPGSFTGDGVSQIFQYCCLFLGFNMRF